MMQSQQLLGDMLVETGLINPTDLGAALKIQAETGSLLGEILVSMGLFGEEALRWALAKQLDVPLIHPDPKALDPGALKLISPERCRRYAVLPITLLPEDDDPAPILTVAAADPSDLAVLEDIRRSVPYKIHVVAALREELMKCLDRIYGPAPQSSIGKSSGDGGTRSDPTGIKLLGKLIDGLLASESRALRIHSSEGRTLCVEGDSNLLFDGGAEWLPVLVERARVLSSMGPEAKRGKMLYRSGDGGEKLLRVVSLSTMTGDELHLRAVRRENKERTLEDFGFTAVQAEAVRRVVEKPGLTIVASPGGDGIISTLYALMRETGGCGKRIAVEEEVVYRSEDATQVEVSDVREVAELLRDLKYMQFDRVLVGHTERSLLPDLLALARRNRRVFAGIEEASLADALDTLAIEARRSPLLGLSMVIFQRLVELPGGANVMTANYEVLCVEGKVLDYLRDGGEPAKLAEALSETV